jgi:hypothetical protein
MKNQNKDYSESWGIKRTGKGRFVIIDTTTGDTLHDSQGIGFSTYCKAYNFGYNIYHKRGKCEGEPNVDDFNTLF